MLEQEVEAVADKCSGDYNFKKTYNFFIAGEFDSCITYSYRSLKLEKVPEVRDLIYYFRATSFMRKKLFAPAEKEYQHISPSFPLYCFVDMHRGEALLEQKRYKSALKLFDRALYVMERSDFGPDLSAIYHNMGLCYLHQDLMPEAEKFLLKALKLQESYGDSVYMVGSYLDLASLYYNQYRDDQAIPYFEKAYALSKKVDNYELRYSTALNMSVVEENRDDFARSLEYMKEANQWKDSLNDQNKVWELAEIEKKFLAEQNAKREEFLKKENEAKATQRNALMAFSGLLFLAFIIAIYFYWQKRKSNRLVLTQKDQLDRLNATKDRLFSIVSHDLRSWVNALRRNNMQLATKGEGLSVDVLRLINTNNSITESTHVLLDNMLNWSLLQSGQLYFHPEEHRLSALVEQVVHNLQPLANEKNIALIIRVEKVRVFADAESLRIVIRNLLDNAIKYVPEGEEVLIASRNIANEVELSIRDTGPGFSETVLSGFLISGRENGLPTGLGLQLCKSIMEKNHGRITLENRKGAIVTLYIPTKNEHN